MDIERRTRLRGISIVGLSGRRREGGGASKNAGFSVVFLLRIQDLSIYHHMIHIASSWFEPSRSQDLLRCQISVKQNRHPS